MSNALLVGSSASATGHPIFVAGPQLGYFFPEVVLEYDLHGGGIDVRGAAVPGLPYVVIGRGKDYAWSATSSNTDIVDTFVEALCGPDDLHYLFKGQCRAMTTFDAGILRGAPGQRRHDGLFHETVHGPVIGYATVKGERVAIAQRSLDARPRAAEPRAVHGAERERAGLAAGIHQDDEQARARVQLALRGQRAHRVRSRARGCRCAHRAADPQLPTARQRRFRLARLRDACAASAGDRPALAATS